MDYNEDRQIVLEDIVASIKNKSTIVGRVDQSNDDKKGYIYLHTIGKRLINEIKFMMMMIKFMVSLNKYNYRTIFHPLSILACLQKVLKKHKNNSNS